jgi:hypothetical protein
MKTYTNPTHIKHAFEPQRLRVVFVTRSGEGIPMEDVEHFCKAHNIVYMTRQYDTREYSEDCEHIQRLPAFHIYEIQNYVYLSTFYPTDSPLEYIKQQLDAYKARETAKKRQREVWQRRLGFLWKPIQQFRSFAIKN